MRMMFGDTYQLPPVATKFLGDKDKPLQNDSADAYGKLTMENF